MYIQPAHVRIKFSRRTKSFVAIIRMYFTCTKRCARQTQEHCVQTGLFTKRAWEVAPYLHMRIPPHACSPYRASNPEVLSSEPEPSHIFARLLLSLGPMPFSWEGGPGPEVASAQANH